LAHYSARLPSVELNNTFYRMPTAQAVEGWRDQVPAEFRFAVKASRRLTHLGRLRNFEEPLGLLLQRLEPFDARLGCVLFQLPPNMRCDAERLEAFLEGLGGRVPAAFEFRHASWFDEPVFALLRAHGAALCVGYPDTELEVPWLATSPMAYVRLRADAYSDADLQRWVDRVRQLDVAQAYVFFKHETAGPSYAMRFMELCSGATRD
jgi:uncharacterized protein YecE (DUF72 family)